MASTTTRASSPSRSTWGYSRPPERRQATWSKEAGRGPRLASSAFATRPSRSRAADTTSARSSSSSTSSPTGSRPAAATRRALETVRGASSSGSDSRPARSSPRPSRRRRADPGGGRGRGTQDGQRARRAKADETRRRSADAATRPRLARPPTPTQTKTRGRPRRTRRPPRTAGAARRGDAEKTIARGEGRGAADRSTRASKRRADIEAVISRPQASAATRCWPTCERLSSELAGTATEHRRARGVDALAPSRRGAPEPAAAEDEPRAARARVRSARPAEALNTREGERDDLGRALEAALAGGPERHHEKTAEQGKLPVRERVARLVDAGVVRRGGAARQLGRRRASAPTAWSPGWRSIGGRKVALMANDPTVKAGSWGPKTVEKILRIQERALRARAADGLPGRLGRRPDHRPGADVPRAPRRRPHLLQRGQALRQGAAGLPAVRPLAPPGGAYIPAFCDVVIMRDGNASMYLGSPRMAEMVIGEKVTLEEMGGAKMHTSVSGCGHFLVELRRGGDRPRQALPLLHAAELARGAAAGAAGRAGGASGRSPRSSRRTRTTPFDVKELIDALVDAGSFLEVHARWAKELVVGLRAARRPGDRDRRQPAEGQGRRAVRRLGRQGRPLHLDLQRLQRPAALPRRRAGVHDRHPGRAPGDHPPRREDDLARSPRRRSRRSR